METYAEWDFKLAIPDKDGISEREHLRQVEKQMGITPIALIPPDFPYELEGVWSIFLELSSTRQIGFNGPLPISYQEIKAWKELTNTPLSPWEVEIIKRLDALYIKVVSNGRH